MQDQLILVLVTVPSAPMSEQIARNLVEKRLAACVNQSGPIQSLYHWQGAIQHDEEVLLIVKTRLELFEQLASVIKENHPYEVPEIIALPIITGSPEYLSWMLDSTS